MNICFNLFFTFLHFVLTYGLLITILFSKNIHHLILALVILVGIRLSYYTWGRCILTLAEDNDHYPTLVRTCSSLFTKGLDDQIAEEIIINMGLVCVMNKVFVLMFLQQHPTLGKWLPT
jgi:hypothetical protein